MMAEEKNNQDKIGSESYLCSSLQNWTQHYDSMQKLLLKKANWSRKTACAMDLNVQNLILKPRILCRSMQLLYYSVFSIGKTNALFELHIVKLSLGFNPALGPV